MKRKIIVILCFVLILLCAITASAASKFNENLISQAKTALTALARSDYGSVSSSLSFSDAAPGAEEWRGLAGSFSTLSSPQTKYALAYWSGNRWKIAVPLHTPDSPSVEVFVLTSSDGQRFSGYGSSSWGNIASEYRSSDYVIWRDEYIGFDAAYVEFDD